MTGSYLPEAQTLVRLRVYEGKPAFEVLTPLRTDDGRLLLVDRGYVTVERGVEVPPIAAPPGGPVTVEGRVRPDEADPQNRPLLDADGQRQIYAADSRAVAAATGLQLEPGRLLLAADQPGVLDPVAVAPNSSSAPFTNFSYALQWLTFGLIAVFALVYFVRLELLQRRPGGGTTERSELRKALAGNDADPLNPPQP